MSAIPKEQIKFAAMQLDASEREALAEELLLSITQSERDAIDQAWLSEARRRDQAYQRGEIGAKSVDEVLKNLTSGGGR